jgi:hypothetical protein
VQGTDWRRKPLTDRVNRTEMPTRKPTAQTAESALPHERPPAPSMKQCLRTEVADAEVVAAHLRKN